MASLGGTTPSFQGFILKLYNLFLWLYGLVFTSKHLEEHIKDYINKASVLPNSNDNNINHKGVMWATAKLLLVNDPKMAGVVLAREPFNYKGYLDAKYGLFSFTPFRLQQLLNGDEWQRFSKAKSSFSDGNSMEVVKVAHKIAGQFVLQLEKVIP